MCFSGTVWAMVGALVLAQLMAAGGVGSPAFIIAFYLTSWMGKGYLAIAGVWGGGWVEDRASLDGLHSPSHLLGPFWHDMSVPVTVLILRQASPSLKGTLPHEAEMFCGL